jgi:hypothetical protein
MKGIYTWIPDVTRENNPLIIYRKQGGKRKKHFAKNWEDAKKFIRDLKRQGYECL